MFNQIWNFAALPANFTTSRHCLSGTTRDARSAVVGKGASFWARARWIYFLVADMLGICPWTDWPANLTAWLWICNGNSIVSRARRFMLVLILATSTPAASLPWAWCPSRFTMTSFTSAWSRHRQLRITHLQNFFALSAEKAWKVNMNPPPTSFF